MTETEVIHVPDAESHHVVLVRFKTKDGEEEAYKRVMREVFPKIRHEPACVEIAGHQDPDDPSHFMVFETWTSEAEFEEFLSGRDYMLDYLARGAELWAGERDLTTWNAVG